MNNMDFDDDDEDLYHPKEEEQEEYERRKYQEEYESPVSMESLGLTWKDFF